MENIKNIHIGKHIKYVVDEKNIPIERISKFLKVEDEEIINMYEQSSIDSSILLKWCKLLKYDFFRIYISHIQLYSPDSSTTELVSKTGKTINHFKKKIYTESVKSFILDSLERKDFTISEAITKYNIPKTTIYRWMSKRQNKDGYSHNHKPEPKKEDLPNYKLLFKDIIDQKEELDIKKKKELHQYADSIKTSLQVITMEEKLVKNNKTKNKINQSLKAYDIESIKRILEYQKENKLTNTQLAIEFKCSRNTIAKWKKLQAEDKLMEA